MTTPATAPVTPERIFQFAFGYAPPLILEAGERASCLRRAGQRSEIPQGSQPGNRRI